MGNFLAYAAVVLAGLFTGILVGIVSLYAFVYFGLFVGAMSLIILISVIGGLIAAIVGD